MDALSIVIQAVWWVLVGIGALIFMGVFLWWAGSVVMQVFAWVIDGIRLGGRK
jgi:hypothetical protein